MFFWFYIFLIMFYVRRGLRLFYACSFASAHETTVVFPTVGLGLHTNCGIKLTNFRKPQNTDDRWAL